MERVRAVDAYPASLCHKWTRHWPMTRQLARVEHAVDPICSLSLSLAHFIMM